MSGIVASVLQHGGDGAMIVLVAALPLLLFVVAYSVIARAPSNAGPWRSGAWHGTAPSAGEQGAHDGARSRAARPGTSIRRSRHRGTSLFHALDLLVLCAAAKLALDRALTMTDEALRPFDPVLARCLAAAAQAAGGSDPIDALEDLAAGLADPSAGLADPGVRRLIAALAAGERDGAPLGATLDELISELRGEEALRSEERAARLPSHLAVPIIAVIVPAALLVTIGPAVIRWLIALALP